MTIGESIRHHRKKLNLTQAQLAERIGVSAQAVSKWENGAGLPDISMAVPLARALGTTTDELLRFGERYQECENAWKEALRQWGDGRPDKMLEVATAVLKEFPYDKTFLYRTAVSGMWLSEAEQDPQRKQDHLARAAAHAQLLLEMDPENQTAKQLRDDLFARLEF